MYKEREDVKELYIETETERERKRERERERERSRNRVKEKGRKKELVIPSATGCFLHVIPLV